MLEEVKTLVTLISPIILFFVGFILNNIATSLKDISKDLNDLKVKMAGEYVSKEECIRLHREFKEQYATHGSHTI